MTSALPRLKIAKQLDLTSLNQQFDQAEAVELIEMGP